MRMEQVSVWMQWQVMKSDIWSLDILSVKKEAKLFASEVAEQKEGRGEINSVLKFL